MTGVLTILGLSLFSVVAVRKREWAIYLILLLLPTYQIRFQLGFVPMTFLESLILILATTELLRLIRARQIRASFRALVQKFPFQTGLIALLLLAAAISLPTSPLPLKAAGLFKAFFVEPIIFYFLILLIIDTPEKLKRLLKSLSLLILYLSVFGIYQFITLSNLPFSWWAVDVASRRITSLVNHPNAFALLLGPPLAMSVVSLLTKVKILKSRLLLLASTLALVAFLLSFSRAGWLALLITVVLFGLLTKQRKRVVVLSLITVLLIVAIPFTREKVTSLVSGQDPSQENRYILWSAAADMLKKSPVLGVGLKGFHESFKNYPLGPDRVVQNYPHNFFLNFWVETGLLGMAAMIGLLLLFYKKVWQMWRDDKQSFALIFAAGMTMVLLHGMVDVPYFKNDLSVLFWAILALPFLQAVNLPLDTDPTP